MNNPLSGVGFERPAQAASLVHLFPPGLCKTYDPQFRLVFAYDATIIDMGWSLDEREGATAGNLFPPLSNDSPVASDDGTSVKKYVTP